MKFLVAISMFFAAISSAHEAKAMPLKAGVIGYGDLLPLPALVSGAEILPGLSAEVSVGFLLLAGAADLGFKYELSDSAEWSPTIGLRSGLNYSFSMSSLYYAATVGARYEKINFDVGPTWYYRQDTENSRDFETKLTVFAGLTYELAP